MLPDGLKSLVPQLSPTHLLLHIGAANPQVIPKAILNQFGFTRYLHL
jgi:hypothetical protein